MTSDGPESCVLENVRQLTHKENCALPGSNTYIPHSHQDLRQSSSCHRLCLRSKTSEKRGLAWKTPRSARKPAGKLKPQAQST